MHNAGAGKYRRSKTEKPDGLLSPDVTAAQSKVHFVCAPFDRANSEADAKWGIDRLPSLVGPDMAAKYGYSVGKLNEAVNAVDADLAEQWAGVCIRGLNAMDAEATKRGHKPARGEFIEVEVPGNDGKPFRIGILKDAGQREAAKAIRPDLMFITPREAALAYQTRLTTPPLAAVKERFPNSEITAVRPNPPVDYANGGDEIPF